MWVVLNFTILQVLNKGCVTWCEICILFSIVVGSVQIRLCFILSTGQCVPPYWWVYSLTQSLYLYLSLALSLCPSSLLTLSHALTPTPFLSISLLSLSFHTHALSHYFNLSVSASHSLSCLTGFISMTCKHVQHCQSVTRKVRTVIN